MSLKEENIKKIKRNIKELEKLKKTTNDDEVLMEFNKVIGSNLIILGTLESEQKINVSNNKNIIIINSNTKEFIKTFKNYKKSK